MITPYIHEHQEAIRQCGIMLGRSKLTSVLSIIAIAISIFLPSGLHYISGYLSEIKLEWQSAYNTTVYANSSVQKTTAENLVKKLELVSGVQSVTMLSPDDLLSELTNQLALDSDTKESIIEGGNPLPYTFLLQLDLDGSSGGNSDTNLRAIEKKITSFEEVETVHLDLGWLSSIKKYASAANKIIALIGAMLVMGMILIISNGIRSEIHKHERLIKVQIICGVSYSFVERPYLYLGFFLGLFGSLIAAIFLILSQSYVGGFPTLFETSIQPSLQNYSLFMLAIGCMIGWFSAFFAIKSHLDGIDLDT